MTSARRQGGRVGAKQSAAAIPQAPEWWLPSHGLASGVWPSNAHTQPQPIGVWARCGHRLHCTLCTLASHGSRTLTRRSNPSNFASTARDTKRGLCFFFFFFFPRLTKRRDSMETEPKGRGEPTREQQASHRDQKYKCGPQEAFFRSLIPLKCRTKWLIRHKKLTSRKHLSVFPAKLSTDGEAESAVIDMREVSVLFMTSQRVDFYEVCWRSNLWFLESLQTEDCLSMVTKWIWHIWSPDRLVKPCSVFATVKKTTTHISLMTGSGEGWPEKKIKQILCRLGSTLISPFF